MPTSLQQLLQLPEDFQVLACERGAHSLQITIAHQASAASCPQCHVLSPHRHSTYCRTLKDVPSGGQALVLVVHTSKWRCRNPTCRQKVFTQRLEGVAAAQARMTYRYQAIIQSLGLFVSGEGGARLGQRLGVVTSPSTLLRQVMRLPDPLMVPPEAIGLDDWAFRRGRRYGTIIVDHARHCVLDVLPDKEATTVATWLRAHPSVRLISRDRGHEFAAAIRQGAPHVTEVLDRWHLLKNLIDLLPAIVGPALRRLRQSLPAPSSLPAVGEPADWKPTPSRPWEAQRLARQEARNALYQQVLALKHDGLTTQQIAQQLQMSVRTVTRWLGSFRQDTRRKRASQFDAYAPYVLARWQEGQRNVTHLWKELRAQGYRGCQRMVARYVHALRQQGQQLLMIPKPSSPLHRYTVTQLQWLLVKWPTDLSEEQEEDLTWFCEHDAHLSLIQARLHAFRRLLHERHPGQIEHWVASCEEDSTIPELRRFARHLREDWPAVVAAATCQASNGQTEGQVHKLKLIKRQTYGRASFALLRKRVLWAA